MMSNPRTMTLSFAKIFILFLTIEYGFSFCFDRSSISTRMISTKGLLAGIVQGPDLETKPDYSNIHGPLGKAVDSVFLTVFRSRMAEKVGVDSSLPKVRSNGIL